MSDMRRLMTAFIADESAATSIEYALIGTLLSVAIIVGATALGTSINQVYTNLGNAVLGAAASPDTSE